MATALSLVESGQSTALKKEEVEKTADYYTGQFKQIDATQRVEHYDEVTSSYYDLATDFYLVGWGTSFHFARMMKGWSFDHCLSFHEHWLAQKLNAKSGDTLLDVGCGVGGPMREIHRLTGASVVGVNLNNHQVSLGNKFNREAGLFPACQLVKGDFMELPFKENHFDGVFAIEATCHAPSLEKVYKQIFNALKPGKRFACYEWCMTDKYDPNDPSHTHLKNLLECGTGVANLVSAEQVHAAVKAAGFNVIETEDLAVKVSLGTDQVPWWQCLCASFSVEGFRHSWIGRLFTNTLCRVLETVHLAPPGTVKTSEFLMKGADALVDAGKQGLFTPMLYFLAEKPL